MSENKGFDMEKMMNHIKSDKILMAMAVGAVLAIVGLFLPWYTLGENFLGVSLSVSPGLNSTGILILAGALVSVGAALNVMNMKGNQTNIVSLIAAIIAGLVVISNWPDSDLGGIVEVSIGYWLSLVGAALLIAGSAMRMKGKTMPTDSGGGSDSKGDE